MAQYTKGPWLKYERYVTDGQGKTIASTSGTDHGRDEDDANARLIAEAPDLLYHLKQYRAKDSCSCDGEACLYCISGEVVALAEGT